MLRLAAAPRSGTQILSSPVQDEDGVTMITPLIPAFSFFDSLLAMTAHTITNNKPMASERRHILGTSSLLEITCLAKHFL